MNLFQPRPQLLSQLPLRKECGPRVSLHASSLTIAVRLKDSIAKHIPGHRNGNEVHYTDELQIIHRRWPCLIIQYFFLSLMLVFVVTFSPVKNSPMILKLESSI